MPRVTTGPPELVEAFTRLNNRYFQGQLAATLEWSTRMRVIAGNCNWHSRLIRLSQRYHQEHPEELDNTMLHEMLHLALQRGHDEVFLAVASKVGAPLKAKGQAERRPFKYRYACPSCGLSVKRRRKGNWGCPICGQGRYNSRYRLRIVEYYR